MPAFARLNRGSVTNSALGPAAGSRDSRPEGNRPKDSGPNNDGPKNDGSMTNDNSNPQYGPTQSADPFGLRKGEVAVELPDRFDASIYFIGRIRTPWNRREDCPKNGREAEAVCTIELDPRWAQGLAGLETTSHVVVLYWMDRARRDLVLQAPRHYGEQRGTFALRSPVRPNPIAMSVARLLRIEGAKLSVVGLDCLDNTPLLDIKPYFASTDAVADTRVGWHATRKP
jgi:tRNA-Thr(GGU) m(6)t(6)A37 methyltransferase TsaA